MSETNNQKKEEPKKEEKPQAHPTPAPERAHKQPEQTSPAPASLTQGTEPYQMGRHIGMSVGIGVLTTLVILAVFFAGQYFERGKQAETVNAPSSQFYGGASQQSPQQPVVTSNPGYVRVEMPAQQSGAQPLKIEIHNVNANIGDTRREAWEGVLEDDIPLVVPDVNEDTNRSSSQFNNFNEDVTLQKPSATVEPRTEAEPSQEESSGQFVYDQKLYGPQTAHYPSSHWPGGRAHFEKVPPVYERGVVVGAPVVLAQAVPGASCGHPSGLYRYQQAPTFGGYGHGGYHAPIVRHHYPLGNVSAGASFGRSYAFPSRGAGYNPPVYHGRGVMTSRLVLNPPGAVSARRF